MPVKAFLSHAQLQHNSRKMKLGRLNRCRVGVELVGARINSLVSDVYRSQKNSIELVGRSVIYLGQRNCKIE